MNLLAIFITGLTTGGLSCLAMQGGLLAGVIANQKDEEHEKENKDFKQKSFDVLDWAPVGMFLASKLVSHAILGFLLGMLGSVITLSLEVRVGFQIFTAVFMFATAMNLLEVHPIFRYVVLQPPKFLMRMVKNKTQGRAFFTPAILGVMTIFIPCGVTQAMEVLAINSANPIQGMLIMIAFVLGTSPVFAVLGIATAKLSETWYSLFTQIASVVLIIMSLYFVNGALTAMGSPYAIDVSSNSSVQQQPLQLNEVGEQEVLINVVPHGYEPNYIQVKQNVPVKLTLKSEGVYTCALAFVFREFGINTFLESTDSQTFEFTPKKKGKFRFSCSMGMYTGVMEVI